MKNARQICDQLWSDLVKLNAGSRCERCSSVNVVQAHHIIPRTNWNLRYDELNGVALCVKHHIWGAHKDALDFVKWLNKQWPGRIEKLEMRRYEKKANDYTLLKIYLETEINKLK